ncbi:MAG: hypothetical protein H7Y36_07440, partial [Armatimonadetes bacterium]|nr:hypothetical protein [Akkermansiaceae bacterium]
MSDETDSSPENLPKPVTETAPRVRRISTPRPKKAVKTTKPAPEEPAPVIAAAESQDVSEAPQSAASETDWPEPEAASAGNPSQAEGVKRKRRRRKGKGKSDAPQNAVGSSPEPSPGSSEPGETFELSAPPSPRPPAGPQPVKGQQPQHQQQQAPRAKIDPELLTKMAWKIYLAEVSEEGVALIGDNDAKDLSRR